LSALLLPLSLFSLLSPPTVGSHPTCLLMTAEGELAGRHRPATELEIAQLAARVFLRRSSSSRSPCSASGRVELTRPPAVRYSAPHAPRLHLVPLSLANRGGVHTLLLSPHPPPPRRAELEATTTFASALAPSPTTCTSPLHHHTHPPICLYTLLCIVTVGGSHPVDLRLESYRYSTTVTFVPTVRESTVVTVHQEHVPTHGIRRPLAQFWALIKS
jgi:hypothetical protein